MARADKKAPTGETAGAGEAGGGAQPLGHDMSDAQLCQEANQDDAANLKDLAALEPLYSQWLRADGFTERTVAESLFVERLAGCDVALIESFADRVKADGLGGKGRIRDGCKDIVKKRRAEVKAKAREARGNRPTDDDIVARVKERLPGLLYGLGSFRNRQDGVAVEIDDVLIRRMILETVEAARVEGYDPTLARVNSVYGLLRDDTAVLNDSFDSDPDLIPLQNGVLHIPTLTLRPHSPDVLFTAALPYRYDATASCPKFLAGVHRGLPDAVGLLQEFGGLALTREMKYEIALWITGSSGGGKSSILGGLEAMLGTRCGILGLADVEHGRFSLSRIIGKTLLLAYEQPALFMKSVYLLNAMISGERIPIEKKFQDPYDYASIAKYAWALNELPLVSSGSSGLFRRVRVLRFEDLPKEEQDTDYKAQVQLEAPGIFLWCLEGLRQLRARGRFLIPESVRQATDAFQLENDRAQLFLQDECIVGNSFRATGQALYDCYRAWCTRHGIRPVSSVRLAGDWTRMHFEHHKIAGTAWWYGVAIGNSNRERFLQTGCLIGLEHKEALASLYAKYVEWVKRESEEIGHDESPSSIESFAASIQQAGLKIDKGTKVVMGVAPREA